MGGAASSLKPWTPGVVVRVAEELCRGGGGGEEEREECRNGQKADRDEGGVEDEVEEGVKGCLIYDQKRFYSMSGCVRASMPIRAGAIVGSLATSLRLLASVPERARVRLGSFRKGSPSPSWLDTAISCPSDATCWIPDHVPKRGTMTASLAL